MPKPYMTCSSDVSSPDDRDSRRRHGCLPSRPRHGSLLGICFTFLTGVPALLVLFSCPAAVAAMAGAQPARNKAVGTASLLLLCWRRRRSGLHKQEQDTGDDCMPFYMSRQGLGVQEITNQRRRVVAVAWRGAGRTCGRAALRPRMARSTAASSAARQRRGGEGSGTTTAPWLRPCAVPGHGEWAR